MYFNLSLCNVFALKSRQDYYDRVHMLVIILMPQLLKVFLKSYYLSWQSWNLINPNDTVNGKKMWGMGI